MARNNALPRAAETVFHKSELLTRLSEVDADPARRARVLRLETALRTRVLAHVGSQISSNASFSDFNTSPFVLMIHSLKRGYTKISQIEGDILPAKEFSSMETSAGRMLEEVCLPEYGWTRVPSSMHSANSSLDGMHFEDGLLRLATLKSGPRCLNDEMSENFADNIFQHHSAWIGSRADAEKLDFAYGVLYGTRRQSNKKDWHILRKLETKVIEAGGEIVEPSAGQWRLSFRLNGSQVNVRILIGRDWWCMLGGPTGDIEVCCALIRACIGSGTSDSSTTRYLMSDLGSIVDCTNVPVSFNVSLLQRSQLPWFFFVMRHFCDRLE